MRTVIFSVLARSGNANRSGWIDQEHQFLTRIGEPYMRALQDPYRSDLPPTIDAHASRYSFLLSLPLRMFFNLTLLNCNAGSH